MAHMARKPNSSLGVVAAAGEAWRTVAVNQPLNTTDLLVSFLVKS
jgi:hypothetical protein